MSHQQYSQGTNNLSDNQMPSAQSWQNQQPDATMPGDFGVVPTQQCYAPAFRPGDMLDENVARREDFGHQSGIGTGPTDVYASHAGQLGATDGRNQFDNGASVRNTGTGRQPDAFSQNPQVYAGDSEPAPPPPAVPQPRAHATPPSTSDKLMGNAEKLAGKLARNERLVERGEARKNGTLNPGHF